jgi:hypothetical protein
VFVFGHLRGHPSKQSGAGDGLILAQAMYMIRKRIFSTYEEVDEEKLYIDD